MNHVRAETSSKSHNIIDQKPPRVSVIIPTYNRKELLTRSLESVLSQTFKPFEIILVDNGSNDNSITDNHISDNGNYGVAISYGFYNELFGNNFVYNRRNADFEVPFSQRKSNTWNENYWSDAYLPRILPKFIFGVGLFLIFYPIPCFNVDWNPATKPYII